MAPRSCVEGRTVLVRGLTLHKVCGILWVYGKEGLKMAVQLCPECGRTVADDAYLMYDIYDKAGITFCCKPCATGEGQCSCSYDEAVE